MSEETHEVIIFKMFGGKPGITADEQGSEVARVQASTYKWAPQNAIESWVHNETPPAGRYAAVDPLGNNYGTGRKAIMNIFTVRYPRFIISCNGEDTIR